jgi:hypothetical protein
MLMGIGGEATEDARDGVLDGVGKVRGTGSRRCGGSGVVECRGIGGVFAGLGIGEGGGGGHGCRGVVHERFQYGTRWEDIIDIEGIEIHRRAWKAGHRLVS